MNYLVRCNGCGHEEITAGILNGQLCKECVTGRMQYIRDAHPWEERGITPEEWCRERGHTWEPYPSKDWPPRNECQVCGIVVKRPPPEPFEPAHHCQHCGKPCIEMVLSTVKIGEVVKSVCPDCRRLHK